MSGQPAVSYGYDAADRLTSVTQGTATVTLGYDLAGLAASLSLTNGVTIGRDRVGGVPTVATHDSAVGLAARTSI